MVKCGVCLGVAVLVAAAAAAGVAAVASGSPAEDPGILKIDDRVVNSLCRTA